MKRLFKPLLIATLLLLLCSTGFAATYYVGSGETYVTITALLAAEDIDGGDIIRLTSNIADNVAWSIGDIGSSGNQVVVDLGGYTIDASGNNSGFYFQAGYSYITIQNGTISGAQSNNILIAGCNDIKLIDLILSNATLDGVNWTISNDGAGDGLLIDGCTITGNGDDGVEINFGDADIGETGAVSNFYLYSSTISSNGSNGLYFHSQDANERADSFIIGADTEQNIIEDNVGSGIYARYVDNLYIGYNLIDNNASGVTTGSVWIGDSDSFRVEWNTVTNGHSSSFDGRGIYADNGSTNYIINNNIVSGHDDYYTTPSGSAGIAITGISDVNTNGLVYANFIHSNYIGIIANGANTTGLKVYNNTLIFNVLANIYMDGSLTVGQVFRNNLLYGAKNGYYENANNPDEDYSLVYYTSGLTFYGFTKGANSKEENPLVLNNGISDVERVANGSIEDALPTINGVSLTDFNSSSALSSVQKHGGSKSAKVTLAAGASYGGVRFEDGSNCGLTSGDNYEIDVYVYLPSGQSIDTINLAFRRNGGSDVVYALTSATDSWVHLRTNFIDNDSARIAYIQGFDTQSGSVDGEYFYYDDLSIKKIDPENGNYNLLPGSPAINAGTDPFVNGDGDQTDLNGNQVWSDTTDAVAGYWVDGVDIGAYSAEATPPEVASVSIDADGTTLMIVFDENVSQGTGYDDADWNIDCNISGDDIGITYVSGNGTGAHTYTIDQTIGMGEVCNIDFNGDIDSMEDESLNDLVAIVNDVIINSSTIPLSAHSHGSMGIVDEIFTIR